MKQTFAAATFKAATFKCGTWTGVGPAPPPPAPVTPAPAVGMGGSPSGTRGKVYRRPEKQTEGTAKPASGSGVVRLRVEVAGSAQITRPGLGFGLVSLTPTVSVQTWAALPRFGSGAVLVPLAASGSATGQEERRHRAVRRWLWRELGLGEFGD